VSYSTLSRHRKKIPGVQIPSFVDWRRQQGHALYPENVAGEEFEEDIGREFSDDESEEEGGNVAEQGRAEKRRRFDQNYLVCATLL
jgi:hypothetical protein